MKKTLPISIAAALGLTMSAGVALAVNGTATKAKPSLEVASGPQARLQIAVTWDRAPSSADQPWRSFRAEAGDSWHAMWDSDTRVPNRIYGSGIRVPGSVKSPEIAEQFAQDFLARHLDLLAPGAKLTDFKQVSNHLDHHGIRSIGFVQSHQGIPVLGGQVSFRFKHDRMSLIGSEALPYVQVPNLVQTLDYTVAQDSARAWIQATAEKASAGAVDGPYILPIIAHRTVTYHTVMRTVVDADGPIGKWGVFVDAATGEVVAKRQMLFFASGTVMYDVPERQPRATRVTRPAGSTAFTINGDPVTSDENGLVTWAGEQPATLVTAVTGPEVHVSNDAGDEATTTLTINPDGTALWDESPNELIDAQLTTYIHSLIVKEYSRRFAPDEDFLTEQLQARVNIDRSCNAFSDGRTINFFQADDECQNTGRLADVVYHEFGHSLHAQSIIPGVGAFDGAFSEGLSDYLAITITNDPGMGRGFFIAPERINEALRHLDPSNNEYRWPDDIAGVHATGRIFGGAMWDLREELIKQVDENDPVAVDGAIRKADDYFYAAVQRATSIPATYAEILLADDDDGDLSNGTPNECLINSVFGRRHGLRDLSANFEPLGAQASDAESYDLTFSLNGLTTRCAGDTILSAELQWGLRKAGNGTPNSIGLQSSGSGLEQVFAGSIPKQDVGDIVNYRIEVKLVDGGTWTFPTNLAESAYQFYVGDVVELYCTNFDSDPFSEGWSHSLTDGDAGKDDWQWGMPTAVGGVDAPAPFTGDFVLGNDLGGDSEDIGGSYSNEMTNFVKMPSVDISAEGGLIYSDVRLQYRRWLTVEDALFDQASIIANDQEVWTNLRTEVGSTHHLDTEWAFHDVPLGEGINGNEVEVSFQLKSDPGLEFGGWTIDDLCIVARADSICGDSQVVGVEECDNGSANSDTEPDGCRTNCRASFCGDNVVDSDEECDFGADGVENGCNVECRFLDGRGGDSGCGCSVGEKEAPAAPLVLLFGFVAIVLRQRFRAAQR